MTAAGEPGDGPPPPAAGGPREGSTPDPGDVVGAGEDERVGIFPSWKALYVTVLVWTALVVGALYAFSVAFDYGVP